jgi:hypothetical protein
MGPAVFAAGLWSFADLSMQGFPDGYLTPFDRQTLLPLQVLITACGLQGFYFLYAGVMGRAIEATRMYWGIFTTAAIIVVPILLIPSCPDSGMCRHV